jgi:hypothetical protein
MILPPNYRSRLIGDEIVPQGGKSLQPDLACMPFSGFGAIIALAQIGGDEP